MKILFIILDSSGNSYYPEKIMSQEKFFTTLEEAVEECKYLLDEGYKDLNVFAITKATNFE